MPRKGQWGQHHQVKRRRAYLLRHPFCVACGSRIDLCIDHIVPRMLGGSVNDEANWQTLCRTCNTIKGTSSATPEQIREIRRRRLEQRPAQPASNVITFRTRSPKWPK